MAAIWDAAGRGRDVRPARRDVCEALEHAPVAFQRPPGGMYGGWHQYMSKDLRRWLGAAVAGQVQRPLLRPRRRGALRRRPVGGDRGRRAAEAGRQGSTDPARGSAPTVKISFTPLPLVDMQYTNRPSGIHQVMQFAP